MKKTVESKFYEFTQNNSGGFFDTDENVCHRVIIGAFDEQEALNILEPMIENQSYSCPCCGDRWSTYSPDAINIDQYKNKGYPVGVYSHYDNAEERWFTLYEEFPRLEEPTWKQTYSAREFAGKIYFNSLEQYCQFLANCYGWTTPDCIIHYLDGTKKQIYSKKIEKNEDTK